MAEPAAEVAAVANRDEPAQAASNSTCPWCGDHLSTAVWQGASGNGFRLRRCDTCRLAHTAPQLSAEMIAPYYAPAYYGSGNVRFNKLFEMLVGWFRLRRARRLQQLHPVPGAVLDIGCGRGHFLRALRQQGWTCSGTELTDTAAVHARETLGLDIHIGPFDGGQFAACSYDAIYLWHVLEHIPNTYRALVEARRMVRPGGLLVIAVPNLASWQARVSHYHWFHLDLPRHYIHCSTPWLTGALKDLGFRIVEVNHFSAEQNIYGWIQSLLNCTGLKFNLLYDILRRPSARETRQPWLSHPAQSLLSVLLAFVLLPFATLAMLMEAAFGVGGTIEVYAELPNP